MRNHTSVAGLGYILSKHLTDNSSIRTKSGSSGLIEEIAVCYFENPN